MNEFSNSYFETIDCPVCGDLRHTSYLEICYGDLKQKSNLDYSLIGVEKKTKLYVKRCKSCGFVFVNPRLKLSYESFVYNECKKKIYSKKAGENDVHRRIDERREKIQYISPLLQTLVFFQISKSNLTLFDFGCGFGYSMGLAREFGLEAYGVDIDRERLSICEKKGLQVAHPDKFDTEYPEIKADIILWMSNIEHLIDIRRAVTFIRDKCRQNAVLYVNGLTPRIIDIERRRGQFVKAHFIEHINYFPIKTLDKYLAEYSFTPLTKPYLSIIKSYKDLFKAFSAFTAGRKLGYNPINGTFARLYRYLDPSRRRIK